MLPIKEFNLAVSRYHKRLIKIFVAFFLTMIVSFTTSAGLASYLRGLYPNKVGGGATDILLGLSVVPAAIVLVAGLWVGENWTKSDRRLACPSCGKMLTRINHLVVATRNCGYCGNRVLAEPEMPY